jgi:predicted adenine nucleotide alpha hydrolase (AANH) superfamily ATPase
MLRLDYDLAGYFYNPNIDPPGECLKRLAETERYLAQAGIPLLIGPYDAPRWREAVRGLEEEPEGGRRCDVCFQVRLETTADAAAADGFDCFATTLTISPHKDADLINRLGADAAAQAGVRFLAADFKQGDGFRIACRLAREADLYRQNYCGCAFARRDR